MWSSDGLGRVQKRFGELRRRGDVRPLAQAPDSVRLDREPTRVVISSPIHDCQGALVGATVVAFSLARENAAITSIERTTLLVSTAVAFGAIRKS